MKYFKEVFFTILSIIAFFVVNKLAFCFLNYPLNSDIDEIINTELSNLTIHFGYKEVFYGILGVIGVFFIYLYNKYSRKNFMEKKEHGSAEWGEKKDIIEFQDKDESKNIILTKTEKLSINTRKTLRNNNVLVIGGSRKWKD